MISRLFPSKLLAEIKFPISSVRSDAMKQFAKTAKRFLAEGNSPTAVEYAVNLALFVIIFSLA